MNCIIDVIGESIVSNTPHLVVEVTVKKLDKGGVVFQKSR